MTAISTFICHVCHQGPANNVTVFRQNCPGEKGIWACAIHSTKDVEPAVAEIVTLIERDTRERYKP